MIFKLINHRIIQILAVFIAMGNEQFLFDRKVTLIFSKGQTMQGGFPLLFFNTPSLHASCDSVSQYCVVYSVVYLVFRITITFAT